MAFSDSVKNAAFRRAGGRCECRRRVCGHAGRCSKSLANGWHAHHITSQAAAGADTLSNCEALCVALDLIRFRRRFSYAAEVLIRRSNSAGLI